MPEPTQTNILNDPISRAEKQGLLKPLVFGKPRPSRPPRMRKDRKRKAILEEFDPLPPQKAVRTIQDYQQKILVGSYKKRVQMELKSSLTLCWTLRASWNLMLLRAKISSVSFLYICGRISCIMALTSTPDGWPSEISICQPGRKIPITQGVR